MRWLIYAGLALVAFRMLLKSETKTLPSHPKPPKTRPPHEVLDVPADASPEQIRSAYQAKIRQYHPDKVANAAPEIQALAEQRTKELNAAYQALTDR